MPFYTHHPHKKRILDYAIPGALGFLMLCVFAAVLLFAQGAPEPPDAGGAGPVAAAALGSGLAPTRAALPTATVRATGSPTPTATARPAATATRSPTATPPSAAPTLVAHALHRATGGRAGMHPPVTVHSQPFRHSGLCLSHQYSARR